MSSITSAISIVGTVSNNSMGIGDFQELVDVIAHPSDLPDENGDIYGRSLLYLQITNGPANEAGVGQTGLAGFLG